MNVSHVAHSRLRPGKGIRSRGNCPAIPRELRQCLISLKANSNQEGKNVVAGKANRAKTFIMLGAKTPPGLAFLPRSFAREAIWAPAIVADHPLHVLTACFGSE